MKIDGIDLINSSSVVDARIENGYTLPPANIDDEGRIFWLKTAYLDYTIGLYVYDGTQWVFTNDNTNTFSKFQHITINTTQVVPTNSIVFVDTSLGGFQASLPPNPSVGDFVTVIDITGSFKFDNLTLVRNGNNIRGVAENLILKSNDMIMDLYFSGAIQGWVYST